MEPTVDQIIPGSRWHTSDGRIMIVDSMADGVVTYHNPVFGIPRTEPTQAWLAELRPVAPPSLQTQAAFAPSLGIGRTLIIVPQPRGEGHFGSVYEVVAINREETTLLFLGGIGNHYPHPSATGEVRVATLWLTEAFTWTTPGARWGKINAGDRFKVKRPDWVMSGAFNPWKAETDHRVDRVLMINRIGFHERRNERAAEVLFHWEDDPECTEHTASYWLFEFDACLRTDLYERL